MPKLSLCMIVKPTSSEAKLLRRCLKYVASHVDEICITQAGKKPCRLASAVISDYNGKESFFKWENDFAKARNFNFKQATGDYILWLDADDIIKGAEKLKETVSLMYEKKVDTVIMNYLYHFDEYKRCITKHLKTRIIKNDGCVEWAGKVHEDFKENRVIQGFIDEDIEILHITDDERIQESAERNLEIAKKTYKKDTEDPRSHWLMANAYRMLNDVRAEDFYLSFIEKSNSEEECYLSYLNLADLMNSTEYALKALEIRPTYPNAYHKMSEILYFHGKKDRARDFIEIGLQMPTPDRTIIAYNPLEYEYHPLMLLMRICVEMGNVEKAITIVQELLKIYPRDKNLIQKNKILQNELGEVLKVDKYVEEAEKINDKKELKAYLENIPEEIRTHPKICALRNINFIKETSSGKDIVYYCGYTSREWNPEIAKKEGIGGSEEAVINLAKRWSEKGWNVTVYNNCGKPKKYDGVSYKQYWEYNYRDKQDVTILWRHPKPVDLDINSDKIFIDLHDVLPEGEFTKERLKKIDKIFVKTMAHRKLFPKVNNKKLAIIPNGVDIDDFNEECNFWDDKKREYVKTVQVKSPYLILNTSSPDRHLSATLDIFEELVRRDPEKPWKLAWYYGWGVYDEVHTDNAEMLKYKADCIERFDKLVSEGRAEGGHMIGHGEIARKYMQAEIFLYPTQFYEIHCISAVKAQLAGCKMLTSDFAALSETNIYGRKVHTKGEKWGTENIFGDNRPAKYCDKINGLKYTSDYQKQRVAKKYDWGKITSDWLEIISN